MATTLTKTLPDLSKLEPLDGKNYKGWSQKLLIFFEQLEVDYVLFNKPSTNVVSNTDVVVDIIWDSLEKKYGIDEAGKKKYVVGRWIKFQMVDDKPIMEQVHEYENLTVDILNEGMEMCEILQANILLEKLPLSWSDCRNQLKHKKNLTLQELISHMRTEESNPTFVEDKFKGEQKKGQKKGYLKKQNYFNKPEDQIQKSKGPCYVCVKLGHKAF
ncbi:uncharacterized protein LOC142175318 [Nicotiana tabacum]|uniref:Uncharacterized protein LOC142175318 n=1 Tax=Nicotiana tabacum TaxID=4097 RepID=A0AC58TLA8_TOBAC